METNISPPCARAQPRCFDHSFSRSQLRKVLDRIAAPKARQQARQKLSRSESALAASEEEQRWALAEATRALQELRSLSREDAILMFASSGGPRTKGSL